MSATRLQPLPGEAIVTISLCLDTALCPTCGHEGDWISDDSVLLRDLGATGPTLLVVDHSRHFCRNCMRRFSAAMDRVATPCGRYTRRVHEQALTLLQTEGLCARDAHHRLLGEHHVHVPTAVLQQWAAAARRTAAA